MLQTVAEMRPTGRVQRQVRRAFIASGGKYVWFGDLMRRAYPDRRREGWRWSVYRALKCYGEPSGQRGWWLPNDELMARIKGEDMD
jgi:hypothetical protein